MIIKTKEDLQLIRDFISENSHISFDIETTGLNPRKDKIVGFGVSNDSKGFYVAHLSWDGEKLVELIDFESCVEILKLVNKSNWTGWNGSFEVRFCRGYFKQDMAASMYSDGMLAKHCISEDRPFALKEVAVELYGESAKDSQNAMKESIKIAGGNPDKDYFMADTDLLGYYCIQDCLLTSKINDFYVKEIYKQKLDSFYFKDEVMPLYKTVTVDMEDKGVHLNLDLINKTKEEITVDILKLENSIQEQLKPLLDEFNIWFLNKELPPRRSGQFAQYLCKLLDLQLPKTKSGAYSIAAKALENHEAHPAIEYLKGGEYLADSVVKQVQQLWLSEQNLGFVFNLSSKDHLKRLFFERLNETPINTTDLGNPQVDDLFLEKMSHKYEWAEQLRQFNKLNKLKSAYMDQFLEQQEGGVFYPSFFQHRTISGRYGSNLQQLPRPKEDGELSELVLKYNNLIRKFFISKPGYVFIDADYTSLEPHVFAHVSGDEGLKNIFKNNLDFYSEVAIKTEKLQGVSPDKDSENYLGKVNKIARQKSKAYVLGIPYGLGGYALSKKLNIPQDEAEKLVEDYLNAFPKLKKWMETTFNQCITLGYVKSEAGRVRRFSKAPKIWHTHGSYILDSLKLYKKYKDSPAKYKQMKYLRSEMKNYINNANNFQIQSLAASITNRACIGISSELKRHGINGHIVASIHDQIIVEVPENQAEKWRKSIQYIMENAYKISLKLSAPAKIAKDFYEGH